MNTRLSKALSVAVPVLIGVLSFSFFCFAYPAHLQMKEQFLLFQYTSEYLRSVLPYPGGLADLVGRFLTQFCLFAPLAALIVALLLVAIQQLVFRLSSGRTMLDLAASCIPAVMVWAHFCHEYSVLGFPVALVLLLLCALALRSIRKESTRAAVAIIAVPLLYLACGPLVILFSIAALPALNKPSLVAVLVLVTAACPFLARLVFSIRPDYLLRGWRYFYDPEPFPVMVWVIAGVTAAVLCLGRVRLDGRYSSLAAAAAAVLVLVLGPVLVTKSVDKGLEEEMEYAVMLRNGDWNGIIRKCEKHPTADFLSMCAVNYALCRRGELPERMFSFNQIGPEGLLPSYTRYHDQPVFAAEVYWHLCMINTCQRFYFEAQESLPDQFKSARYTQRLAQTNAVNEDYAVAYKYRDALLSTLFYRRWAKDFDPQDPEYRQKRELKFKLFDAPFDQSHLEALLGQLYLENKANKDAYHYAVAIFLLKKDLGNFIKALGMESYTEVPKAYQEAFLILFAERNHSLEGLPAGVSPKIAARFTKFVESMNAERSVGYMKKHFGDTYWFYFYYVNYSS